MEKAPVGHNLGSNGCTCNGGADYCGGRSQQNLGLFASKSAFCSCLPACLLPNTAQPHIGAARNLNPCSTLLCFALLCSASAFCQHSTPVGALHFLVCNNQTSYSYYIECKRILDQEVSSARNSKDFWLCQSNMMERKFYQYSFI